MLVGGAISIALAIGFAFGLGQRLTKNWRLAKSGKTATGVVIDQRDEAGADQTNYYPVVRFKAADGSEHRFTSHFAWSGKVGDSVPVRYDAADAAIAQIDTDDVRWRGFPLGVAVMLIFAALGAFLMRKGARRPGEVRSSVQESSPR